MLNEPLPSQIDVRKLVSKGAEIKATFSPGRLPRFIGMLAEEQGTISAELQFYIDEERKRRLDGKVHAEVAVSCQRCLEPVSISVDSEFHLAIVWTDEEARQLPRSLDPLIVGEELIDLADVVEEELILSLPFVSYHDTESCHKAEPEPTDPADLGGGEVKKNPFQVLEQLKSSD